VPTPESNKPLKKKVRERIESGEIKIGEVIVPKKYESLPSKKK